MDYTIPVWLPLWPVPTPTGLAACLVTLPNPEVAYVSATNPKGTLFGKPLVSGATGTASKGALSGWHDVMQNDIDPLSVPIEVQYFGLLEGGLSKVAVPTTVPRSLLHSRLPPQPYWSIPSTAGDAAVITGPVVPGKPGSGFRNLTGPALALAQFAGAIGTDTVLPIANFANASPGTGAFASLTFAGEPTPLLAQVWTPKTQSWTAPTAFGPGDMDYIEASSAASTFSFGVADATIASAHFRPSFLWPGGDDWRTNTLTPGCAARSLAGWNGLAGNSTNDVPASWCPPDFSKLPELADYDLFYQRCDDGHYQTSDSTKHWSRYAERMPFSGLFGHTHASLSADGRVPGPGTSGPVDTPSSHFSGGDLAHTGLIDTRRLHMGLDFNWVYPNSTFTESWVAGYFSPVPSGGIICFGGVPFAEGDVQVALSCDDASYDNCDGAEYTSDGCGLARFLTDKECLCDGFVSCLNAGLDPLCLDDWLTQIKHRAQLISVALTGEPGDADDLTLFKQTGFTSTQPMEHEMEYNLAVGDQDHGLGIEEQCSEPSLLGPLMPGLNCTMPGYCLPTLAVPDIPFLRDTIFNNASGPSSDACDILTNTYGNVALAGLGTNALPQARVIRDWTAGTGFDSLPQLQPVSFAPGVFQGASGVWGQFLPKAGFVTPADFDLRTGIVPDNPALGPAGEDDPGFRMDLLGDLIVDCGHLPLHTEIHPPQAIVLHLGDRVSRSLAPGLSAAGRFSVFGWQRASGYSSTYDLVVDMWPSTQRPTPASTLTVRAVTALLDAPTSVGGTPWTCAAYPPGPGATRVRCTLTAGAQAKDSGGCQDAPGLRPDCATNIGGLFVDLVWSTPS
ncbi:MAG: hypothetical protein ACHREM_09525 [Polyangiales bacterium]